MNQIFQTDLTTLPFKLTEETAPRNSHLATRNSQPATRNSQLATRNSQLASRNSQLATSQLAKYPVPM